MLKKIYLIGNVTDKVDSMALKVVEKIQNKFPYFSFMHWDPTEEFPEEKMTDFLLIDTIAGIKNIHVYYNLDDFVLSPRNSAHDFDLPVALRLLQKLGKIQKVTIIGVPQKGNDHELASQLEAILASISL